MTKLTIEQIRERLNGLGGWELRNGRLRKEWRFKDFKEALQFINRVGELAEANGHHPDIYNSYATVRLELFTHDAQGITEKDFKLAEAIDRLFS